MPHCNLLFRGSKKIEEIIYENAFEEKKRKPGLKFTKRQNRMIIGHNVGW